MAGAAQTGMDGTTVPQGLTFPSVLNFLHREHDKFERERKWWAAEKAELQARIAFLEGQRLGEANLKRDLLRRIKMLERSLVTERAKNSNGVVPPETATAQNDADEVDNTAGTDAGSNVNVDKEGRHVLLQYLSEMQCTDAVIESQAQRVRGMLDSWSPAAFNARVRGNGNDGMQNMPTTDGYTSGNYSDDHDDLLDDDNSDEDDDENLDDFLVGMPTSVVADTEAHARQTQDLHLTAVDPHAEQVPPNVMPLPTETPDSADDIALQQRILKNFSGKMSKKYGGKKGRAQAKDMFDPEPEDLDAKLGELSSVDASAIAAEATGADGAGGSAGAEMLGASGGEQAGAKVGDVRKSWKMKMELRGHLDGVREVVFHPHEPLLISMSEDATAAVWEAAPTPKSKLVQASEPLRILRGHKGPVYAGTFARGGTLYTGGADGALIAWSIPSAGADKYPLASEGPRLAITQGHEDVVWSLDAHRMTDLVASGSADGVCKLWDASSPALQEKWSINVNAPITAVNFLRSDMDKVLVGAQNGTLHLVDVETGKTVTELRDDGSDDGEGTGYLYDAKSHPTMNVFAASYGAKHVKVFDIGSGSCVHTMVAHPSAVSSIDFDPSGLYMISSGHNRSIRIWDFGTKKCVYENTTHRHKHDESIHAARFHPNSAYYASAGADAIVRMYC